MATVRFKGKVLEMKKRVVFGLPLTPTHLLEQLQGHSFCVSYFTRKTLGRQLDQAIRLVGADEILLVDNGAFSAWRSRLTLDESYWDGFARWASAILRRSPQAVVIVPDVIDGDETANDMLAHDFVCSVLELRDVYLPAERLMVVWHMHESIDRLLGLVEAGWSYLAIGSSGQYARVGTPQWHARIEEALAALDRHCAQSNGAYVRPWLHMMRAQSQAHAYGFDSSDSTNVAVNHHRYKRADNHVASFAGRIRARITAGCSMIERHPIQPPGEVAHACTIFDQRMRWSLWEERLAAVRAGKVRRKRAPSSQQVFDFETLPEMGVEKQRLGA